MREQMPESLGAREQERSSYTGLFVEDPRGLLSRFPPKHRAVFAHHSTTTFRPETFDTVRVGEKSVLRIIGRVWDEKGDALLVDNPASQNAHPHITVSCAPGVEPFYSNAMIKKALAAGTIEYFDPPEFVDVTEGYYDGKRDVVSPL